MRRILVLGLVLISFAVWSQQEVQPGKTDMKEAGKIWGEDVGFIYVGIPEKLLIDSGLVFDFDKIFKVKSGAEKKGYLLMTRAAGRFEYFDYNLYYSNELKVIKAVVTAYRSTRGAGICSKGWLKQFEGYDGKPMKVGEDIQAISGATISANSITNDIARCQKLMQNLLNQGYLQ